MYITSTLVSDEANSETKPCHNCWVKQRSPLWWIPKHRDCSAFCSELLRLVSLERDSMVDSVSPVLTIICLHCPMALVHASARRVPFSSRASFCLSLLTPLSRWPESNAARPLAGGSPLFWWHALRSMTLILVNPLQMKALYVRPMLSSFDVASHPVDVEDHVQQR